MRCDQHENGLPAGVRSSSIVAIRPPQLALAIFGSCDAFSKVAAGTSRNQGRSLSSSFGNCRLSGAKPSSVQPKPAQIRVTIGVFKKLRGRVLRMWPCPRHARICTAGSWGDRGVSLVDIHIYISPRSLPLWNLFCPRQPTNR